MLFSSGCQPPAEHHHAEPKEFCIGVVIRTSQAGVPTRPDMGICAATVGPRSMDRSMHVNLHRGRSAFAGRGADLEISRAAALSSFTGRSLRRVGAVDHPASKPNETLSETESETSVHSHAPEQTRAVHGKSVKPAEALPPSGPVNSAPVRAEG